jgi:hypothetical protein
MNQSETRIACGSHAIFIIPIFFKLVASEVMISSSRHRSFYDRTGEPKVRHVRRPGSLVYQVGSRFLFVNLFFSNQSETRIACGSHAIFIEDLP